MPRKTIDEYNAQLKKAAGLHRRAIRERYRQTLVEGPQAVRELLTYQPHLIRDVFVSPIALTEHPDIATLLAEVDPYVHVADEDLLAQAAPAAQNIFATINVPDEADLADYLAGCPKLTVFALDMADPGNLGTLIRSADAAGAGAVILGSGSVDATSPKVIRSTVGSSFHLPIFENAMVGDVVLAVRAAGIQVLVADGGGEADLATLAEEATAAKLRGASVAEAPAGAIDLRRPTLWMFGNEAHGVTPEQRELADAVVGIPMWGKTESLNVSMAATLCVYASAVAQN